MPLEKWEKQILKRKMKLEIRRTQPHLSYDKLYTSNAEQTRSKCATRTNARTKKKRHILGQIRRIVIQVISSSHGRDIPSGKGVKLKQYGGSNRD